MDFWFSEKQRERLTEETANQEKYVLPNITCKTPVSKLDSWRCSFSHLNREHINEGIMKNINIVLCLNTVTSLNQSRLKPAMPKQKELPFLQSVLDFTSLLIPCSKVLLKRVALHVWFGKVLCWILFQVQTHKISRWAVIKSETFYLPSKCGTTNIW